MIKDEPAYNSIEKLPDEILLHILGFCVSDPINIVHLSHINKRMERILNSSPMVVSKMMNDYASSSSISGGLRIGYMIGRFLEDPIRNGITLFKKFTSLLLDPIGRPRKNEENDSESKLNKFREVKQYVNSKQRIVHCLKLSQWDCGRKIKNIEKWFQIFERSQMDRLIFMIATGFSMTLQYMVGKIGSTPSDQWSLDTGLWWLPYAFWPFEGTIIGIILISILFSILYSIKVMRLLIIHPTKKSLAMDISTIYMAPIASVFYTTMWRIFLILIRSLIYQTLGIELSNLEWFASKVFYYAHYPGLLYLGFSSLSTSINTIVDKCADPTLASFISLSLFKYSGNLLSFIPLSLGLCCASIKEMISDIKSPDKFEQLIPMALSLSTAFVSFGHFSYLTLAPITACLFGLVINTFNRRKFNK